VTALRFPYRIDRTGRTAEVPVPSADYARQLIVQVLRTAPGERVMRPGLGSGVQQMVFAPTGDEAASAAQHLVQGALQQWLGAWVDVLEVAVHGGGEGLEVTVRYRLRHDGTLDEARAVLGT
jgi:uncharacterized protein